MKVIYVKLPLIILCTCVLIYGIIVGLEHIEKIQPVQALVITHRDAKARIPYQPYAKYDYTYVPVGTTSPGNCAKFAYTVWSDLKSLGFDPAMVSCTIRGTSTRHVYVRLGSWVSDVRYKDVIRASQVDCQ